MSVLVQPTSTSPRPPTRLSALLKNLLDSTAADDGKKELTLGLVVETTGESAFGVLMAFLCLPFLTPIPVPVISIPFGIALFLLGCQIAIRKHRPWLPQRLMKWRLPHRLASLLIGFVARVLGPMERVIHPRLLIMQSPPGMVLAGIALAIDGFLLAFFPPIVPFTNAIPAWMAMVKILGITEKDGGALLTGTILTFAVIIGVVVALIVAVVSGVSIFG